MKTIKKFALWILLAAMLFTASACAQAEPAGLSEDELKAVADNILRALDSGNREQFVQNMNPDMQAYFTQAQFDSLSLMIRNASGSYISVDSPTLSNNQGYALYRFPAKYGNETVYVTISFKVGGDKVEGIWFDSPNLRKQPQQ